MKYEIQKKLREIEQKENVKILYCVESGSRAWGFASPDSDYDIRFIYTRTEDFYLKLEQTSDVIQWQLDDVFDINGWDLQKMLRLLHGSNPTVFEWKNSPIVYRTSEEWNKIIPVIEACFQEKPCLFHYLSMAKKHYLTYFKTDNVTYKKYFYVLRPVFACRWILEKHQSAPMLFSDLLKLDIPEDIRNHISKLIDIKVNSVETANGKRIDALDKYIENTLADLEQKIRLLPEAAKPRWEELNRCFISAVK